MPKVLVSDKLSNRAIEIFAERGVEADFKPGLSPEELLSIIGDYDGLAIRSATKVTPAILEAATNLKVIGRAGIGVDNVDIPAATGRGVVVMNTPFGNSITTAEHAIAMMFALARQIPQANASTHAGKWEKSKFMGSEVYGKTLGLIGCGNIGSIVADRALGLSMHVVAYDPFLNAERAEEMGVEKVELDDLLRRADFITLHTPLIDATRNILDAEAFRKTKKGVRVINCARGGLVDEDALKDALDSGHVAGAALDVFAVEPAKEHPLFGMDNVVCTPHLGASTSEAQENVAIQVAEQMSDFLLSGAVSNALNMPSVTAEDAPRLKPYMKLAEQIGAFGGQLAASSIKAISVSYEGDIAGLNVKPLTATILMGVLRPQLESVNMVSAPLVAKERNIDVSETRREKATGYQTLVRLQITTETGEFSVRGTVFAGEKPRIVGVEDINLEAELSDFMLYVTNEDKPGLIGALGTLLGNSRLNISNFHLGRRDSGNGAVALVAVDEAVPDSVVEDVSHLPSVTNVRALKF